MAENVSMKMEYLLATTSILDEEVEEQLVARHKNAFTKCTLSTKY